MTDGQILAWIITAVAAFVTGLSIGFITGREG